MQDFVSMCFTRIRGWGEAMIMLFLKCTWIRIVSLCSVILGTGFPGSREGDSQIAADEKGTRYSISILPQHPDT